MVTGKAKTFLKQLWQLSTERHQWWGTQKVRGFPAKMQTSRLSRRRQTVRPREVVLLSRGRPVNCWVVSDWMPTCSLSRSQCPVASGLWLLLLTQDVLLCCVLRWWCPESGVRHCKIAFDRSSHFRKRLPTSLVNFVRGANTSAIDCAKAAEGARVRGAICDYREYVTRPPHSDPWRH